MTENQNQTNTEEVYDPSAIDQPIIEDDVPALFTEENMDERSTMDDEASLVENSFPNRNDEPPTPDYLQSSTDEIEEEDPKILKASSNIPNKDVLWDNAEVQAKFKSQYGENAKKVFDQEYTAAIERQFEETERETDTIITGTLFSGGNKDRLKSGFAGSQVEAGPIGGGYYVSGAVKGQTRSVREADISSKNLVNENGELVKVDDEWFDVIGNAKYRSADGRDVVALEYVQYDPTEATEGAMKAVYEGDRPEGEVASYHDLKGWWTSNIGMETNATIPRAVGKAVVNTVADLVIGTVGVMNSLSTLFDADNKNATIENTRDAMTKMKMLKMSNADYDQQNMLTFANGADLVANVAAQLLLGGAIGKAAGGVSKLIAAGSEAKAVYGAKAALAKLVSSGTASAEEIAAATMALNKARVAENAVLAGSKIMENVPKAATLTTLSLLGANEIRDEALNAGFSEDAAASLFLAFLPAMYAANELSELVITGESLPFMRSIIKDVIKKDIINIPKEGLSNPSSIWATAKLISEKLQIPLKKAATTLMEGSTPLMEMGAAATAEGFQEMTEEFVGDVMKTSANILAEIGTPKGQEAPHMLGMYDAEYWASAPVKYMMSAVGGAIGGPMARFAFGSQHSNALAFKSGDADKLLRMTLDNPNSKAMKMYEAELEAGRTNGLLGSDKYSYERDADGKFILLSTLTPEERAKTMSVAEANYRMRKLQLNQLKAITNSYNGTYAEFVKEHPEVASLLTDKDVIQSRIFDAHNELSKLYSEVGVEKQQAADKLLAQKQPTANAEGINASDQIKSRAKSNEDTSQTTSNEKSVSVTDPGTTPFTEQEREFAGVLGISDDKARIIMNKEQEMRDILSGKTAEEDLIKTVIKANPGLFSGLGSNPDEIYKNVAGNLLDNVIVADLATHNKISQQHANFITKRKEFEDKIELAQSLKDIQDLSELVNDGDQDFYVSAEKLELLKSKIKNFSHEAITDMDIVATEQLLAKKFNILTPKEMVNKGLEFDAEIQAATSAFTGTAEHLDSIEEYFEENYEKALEFARSQYITGALKSGKTGVAEILKAKGTLNKLDLIKAIANSYFISQNSEGDPTANFGSDYAEILSKGTGSMITQEEGAFADIRSIIDMERKFTENRSELTAAPAGPAIDMLGRMIVPTKNGVKASEETFKEHLAKLEAKITPTSQIFDAIEDAEEGLAAAKIRAAQLNLLFKLGDPYNKKALANYTNEELFRAANTLAILRDLNASVLSPSEFRDSVENTKYSKFSKFISGWLFDPQKLVELARKGPAATASEQKQFMDMMQTIQDAINLYDELVTSDNSIITRYEHLIALGKESQDEAAVARKFKKSTLEYFKNFNGRLGTATSKIPSEDLRKSVMQMVNIVADNDTSDENLTKAYDLFQEISQILYNLPKEAKKDFIDSQIGSMQRNPNNDIIAMMISNSVGFYNNYNSVLTGIEQKAGAQLIVPTIDQEIASMEAYAFITRNEGNLLTSAQRSAPRTIEGNENIIFVPGSYGTGKTQIVFGMAVRAAQLKLNKIDPTRQHRVMVCANNLDQVNNLNEVAKKFDIERKGSFTAEELLQVLTKPDAAKDLDDVSVIVFDEVTYLDLYESTDPTKQSTIHTISKALSDINKTRAPGQPPLTLMGIGDAKQGGWREDMPNRFGEVMSTASNRASNISTMNYIYSTRELVDPFRSFVSEINKFANNLKSVHRKNQASSFIPTNEERRLTTMYGTIEDGKKAGCEVVDVVGNLYTDELAKNISEQIAKDPDFKVLIVDDVIQSVQDLPEGEFKKVAVKHGSNFTIRNVPDIDNIKLRNIKDAQGLEASYVIINLPTEVGGWLPPVGTLHSTGYRYELVSMLVGRARYYAKIRIDQNVDVSSSNVDTMKEIKSSLAQFMGEWSALRLGILRGMITEEPEISTVVEEIKPPVKVNYILGESVVMMDASGNTIGTAIVTSLNKDGDIVFTDNNGITREENINDGSNLGNRFVRDSSVSKQSALPQSINYEVGESIAIYNMARAYGKDGYQLTNTAEVTGTYIDKGDRWVIIHDHENGKVYRENLDRKVRDGEKAVTLMTNKFRRVVPETGTAVESINKPSDIRENAYANYDPKVHGDVGLYNGKVITVMKIDNSAGIVTVKYKNGKTVDLPLTSLGDSLLINKIERRNETQHIEVPDTAPIITPVLFSPLPNNNGENSTEWEEIAKSMASLLGVEQFFFEDLDDYIDQFEDMANQSGQTKEEKAETVNALNVLQAIKTAGEPDPTATEDQKRIGKLLEGSNNFEPDTDWVATEEAKAVLSAQEADGLLTTYSEVRTAESVLEHKSAVVKKYEYSKDLFGLGNTPQPENIEEESLRAMGLSIDGKKGMMDYKYSFVSYQYVHRDKKTGLQVASITHAIVAENKAGLKFVVTLFPTNQLAKDGNTLMMLENRISDFSEIAGAYIKSGKISQIPGSVISEQTGVRNKTGNVPLTADMKTFNKVPLIMSTDITAAVQNNKIIKGKTQGSLVTSSESLRTRIADDVIIEDSETVLSMPNQIDDNELSPEMTIAIDSFNKPINDSSIAYYGGKANILQKFDGENVVSKYKDYFIIHTKISARDYFFVTKDGFEFTPIFGFTQDGEPIVDPTGEFVNSDTGLQALKDQLESRSVGLDVKMKGVGSWDENLEVLRSKMASLLHYSLPQVDNAITQWSGFKTASSYSMKRVFKSFKDFRIKLSDLHRLLGSRKKNLTISNPMVLSKNLSDDADSALKAGRPFVFYSYNKQYDLNDPSVIKGLEQKFKDYLEQSGKEGVNNTIIETRDGIGIIMLDHSSYSLSDLYGRYSKMNNESKNSFNRYVIPTGSDVGNRLLAFFTDVALALEDMPRAGGRSPQQYSRLPLLREANTENGKPIRVLNDIKMRDFLYGFDKMNPEVKSMILSIIDSMTKDSRMGHYVTDAEFISTTATDKLYPGLDPADFLKKSAKYEQETGKPVKLKIGTDSRKPITHGMDNSPIVFIPAEVAKRFNESYQPMKFNLEAFFKMVDTIRSKEDPAIVNEAFKVLDQLMQDHSLSGTLSQGIKIPPAVVSTNKTDMWYELPMSDDLMNELTTNVKDIKAPGAIIDINALGSTLENSATKAKQADISAIIKTKVDEAAASFNGVVESELGKLSKVNANSKNFDSTVSKIMAKADDTLKTLKNHHTAVVKTLGGDTKVIDELYKKADEDLKSKWQSSKPITVHSVENIRSGNLPKFDEDAVEEADLKQIGFSTKFKNALTKLRYVVDATAYEEIKAELNVLVKGKPYFKNYLAPIWKGLDPVKSTLGTRKTIDEIIAMAVDPENALVIPKLTGEQIESRLASLERLESPAGKQTGPQFRPEHKTRILEAWINADADTRLRLEPYLYSDITNPSDPANLKFALFEAFTSDYPVQISTTESLIKLKDLDPKMHDQLINSPDVIVGLTKEIPDNGVKIVVDLQTDIDTVINGLTNTDEKLSTLNALDMVVEGLTSILPPKVINNMKELLKAARSSVNNVRSQGSGADILGFVQKSDVYKALQPSKIKGGNNITQADVDVLITRLQEQVGELVTTVFRDFNGETLTQEEKFRIAPEAAILGDEIFKITQGNEAQSMLLASMLTKARNVC